jgi:Ca2+-dependent lipid-binding protein
MNLNLRIVQAVDVPKMDANASDPYIKIQLTTTSLKGETKPISNTTTPRWDESFYFPLSSENSGELALELWDKDIKYDDKISTYRLPIKIFAPFFVHDLFVPFVSSVKNKSGG